MNDLKKKIRKAILDDLPEMQALFVDSISTICINDYTPKQIKVWTSAIENTQKWKDKLSNQYFLIAEIEHKIVGYASLENSNYLDFLYIHKDFQRQGIAKVLYNKIEKEALKRTSKILKSDVSITARPFFEKQGFLVIEPQVNIRQGVEIVNYRMTKLF